MPSHYNRRPKSPDIPKPKSVGKSRKSPGARLKERLKKRLEKRRAAKKSAPGSPGWLRSR